MGSILVLGGAGYIGSHTVYELIDTGKNVVIVDNLLTGFREAVHPEAKFYQGDIRDRAFMDSVFEKEDIDGVIHFAASSQVGESMKDRLSITVIIYAVPRCFWRAWWPMELIRSSFLPPRQRMESLRAFQSWKQIRLFRPTAMGKRSCPWKKCSTGPLLRTI